MRSRSKLHELSMLGPTMPAGRCHCRSPGALAASSHVAHCCASIPASCRAASIFSVISALQALHVALLTLRYLQAGHCSIQLQPARGCNMQHTALRKRCQVAASKFSLHNHLAWTHKCAAFGSRMQPFSQHCCASIGRGCAGCCQVVAVGGDNACAAARATLLC